MPVWKTKVLGPLASSRSKPKSSTKTEVLSVNPALSDALAQNESNRRSPSDGLE